MTKDNYKEYTIEIGGRKKIIKTKENYISTFIINDEVYLLLGSNHSIDRLNEYGISKSKLAGKILSLGDKLKKYNNSGKHLLMKDKENKSTYIFTIERNHIVVITVMGHGTARVSDKYASRTIVV